ncbi:MAG: 50S ribosomal protein L23 [Nisaea sp.]|nr:50S ribosomal protein L23 [Nisaea sp.]
MSKIDKFSILRRPIVTEKSTLLQEDKRYSFEVAVGSTKLEIKQAVEDIFDVKVLKVSTINVKGKTKRFGPRVSQKKSWKKAIVTIAPGDAKTLFEGV